MYRVRVLWQSAMIDELLTTFYFNDAAGSAGDAVSAVGDFLGDLQGAVSNVYTAQIDPNVFTINQATGQPTSVDTFVQAPIPMQVAGPLLPLASQGLLQLRTGAFVGGREIRGRLFIPGGTEGVNDVGRPEGPYLDKLELAGNTLTANTTCEWVVYSRTKATAATINTTVAWTEWASLRKRRDG